MAIITKVNR